MDEAPLASPHPLIWKVGVDPLPVALLDHLDEVAVAHLAPALRPVAVEAVPTGSLAG